MKTICFQFTQRVWAGALIVSLLCLGSLEAEDWPQWRGPNRDGTVVGFSIPDVWPESLDKQWSVDVGDGYSSPVVSDGQVYQLSRQGDEEHVRCLKLDSGKSAPIQLKTLRSTTVLSSD